VNFFAEGTSTICCQNELRDCVLYSSVSVSVLCMEHEVSLCAAIEYIVPSSERSEIEVVGFPDCHVHLLTVACTF